MNTELHWQIALNQFCPIPQKFSNKGYSHSYKWGREEPFKENKKTPDEKKSDMVRQQLALGKTIEQVSSATGAPMYYIRRIMTRRSKVIKEPDPHRVWKRDKIIDMHYGGFKNQDIDFQLGKSKQYVSQVISRHKKG